MKKSITFVGLDVHKNSIAVAIADAGRNAEVRNYGIIGGTLAECHDACSSPSLRFLHSFSGNIRGHRHTW